MAKKVVTWLVIAFVLFWLIAAPQDAANLVGDIASALRSAAQSLATFFNTLGN